MNIDAEVTAARRLRDDLESAVALARAAWPSSPRRRAPSWVRPGPTCWPNGPRSCATSGSGPSSSSGAGPGPRPWAGPTPTPSPRPWANGPSSARTPTSPSPSCGPRSSSRRWPSPARDGSGAFGWPSPSSSPTPGGCCGSSPASPKAWSTSSPSTWWWPRIIAVAAVGPDPAGPTVYHVASSVRNPLRYGELVDLVRSWFTEHPLYDSDGQPIMVPEWSFPGRGRVQRQLQRATRALTTAERVLGSLPVRGERADLAARVEERRAQAERALGYTELYGAYTETEAHFRVDRLLVAVGTADAGRPGAVLLRPRGDLVARLRPRRPPAVGGRARPGAVHAAPLDDGEPLGPGPERHPGARAPPGRLRPREHPGRLQRGGVLRVAGEPAPPRRRAGRVHGPDPARGAGAARPRPARPGRLPAQLLPPLRGRARASCCATTPLEMFHHLLLAKSFPAGFARVRAHRALGHRTVLITGALDFVVEPLRPLFDEVVCARLGEDGDGRFTGRLDQLPPTGEARALVLAEYAAAEGLDLGEVGGLRRLGVGPPAARVRRVPGGGEPRGPAGRHRPPAGLARRAVGQGRRRGAPAASLRPRRPRRVALVGPPRGHARTGQRRRARRGPGTTARTGEAAMKGLVFERNLARFAASRVASAVGGSGRGGGDRAAAPHRRGAARAPRARVAPGASRAGRHLRVGPVHRRRPQLPLLRGRRELPLRPRPRGGRERSTTPTPGS